MRGLLQENLAETANAYMAWWRLAGVDCAIGEEPTNWLRPVQEPPRKRIAASDDAPAQAKPQSFDSFLTWLAEDAAQPERRWPGAALMPAGPVNAPLMVITDMPDPADIGAGALLSERAGQLFDAMLRTIGLKRQDIHLGSLFLSRPPGAMVEASDLAAAAARMRTHVMLASPRRLLLLGDRTIRTLLPTPETGLRNFNHDGGTLPAFATFHPRLLLGQPAAKAECWRVLQGLIEEMTE
ncbi:MULTISPECIES: uracil-DNA glycosylase family protein [Sphingobium]|uniref:uracil-DNA glycosylase family protein n=1 Tax=Sphingobium TaxID=165695 RepID=UPI0005CBBD59|nr:MULTISPECIES: uracil-DNA glycosylase family protein [Sphingobium]UXC92067.1 uracil-DNA glycosylase [Sphingobium sp. RSMS]WDA37643.1 uracil-DNA glycosylase family protein [Sphingobium sp. YC-XJ3]